MTDTAETYWQALLDATPDVVLVVDLDGTVRSVNRVAAAFSGRTVVGGKIWDFAVGADAQARLMERLAEVVRTRQAVLYDHPGVRAVDGTLGWYEVRAIPVIIDGAVQRIIWSSSDVSERKRLEEQLWQAQKMEAIGLLAGGVAHDFNNILAVIMGFSDLALRAMPAGHPLGESLREISDAARRGGDLTRRLLAFSRKQIIKPEALDLGSRAAEFAIMVRRILGEDVELVVHEPITPLVVKADAVQLEQVLMNLCTNARQAMRDGGKLHISLSAAEFDPTAVGHHPWARVGLFAKISVTDTGAGMDPTTLARAVEPFFTTKPDGTGLGLSTVHGIVEQHGGFLHMQSALGEGTTIDVYLPRALDGAVAGHAPAPREVGVVSGKEVILLAEDEPALRTLVTKTLTTLGYSVIAVSDGEEAVSEFERRAPEIDLALLDVVLPRLNARQVYDRIRALRPDVKVLFTTGYAPASTRLAELLAAGEVRVLEKPFTTTALATSVRKALDGGA